MPADRNIKQAHNESQPALPRHSLRRLNGLEIALDTAFGVKDTHLDVVFLPESGTVVQIVLFRERGSD
jgi:hypothetical protein